MASDPPPQPDDDAELDLSEMSESDRRREMRRQARLTAKKEKAELARIRKEMEAPRSKWIYIWGAVLVFLLFILGYGGYRFYSYYSTNLARKSFMDDYNLTDLAPLRRYAPEELKEIEELKRVADDRGSGMGTGEIVEQYRKANAALQTARETARENKELYETTLAEFNTQREKAIESKLDKYATSLWTSIEEARKVATQDTANVFSFSLAMAKLREGIEMLKQAENSHKAIAELDRAFTAFEESYKKVDEGEWSQNLPDELNLVRGILNNAVAARQAGQWQQSAQLYTEAKGAIDPNLEKLLKSREAADAKLAAAEQLLRDAQVSGISDKAKDAWQQLGQYFTQLKEARAAYNYPQVMVLSEQMEKLVAETQETIRLAKEGLVQRLKDLKAIHDEAQNYEKFFRLNMRDEWHELDKEYLELRTWLREADDVAILNRATKLIAKYKALLSSRKELVSGLDEIRERLTAIEADPMSRFVEINFPDAERELFTLRHSVARLEKRGNFEAAAKEYEQIAGILEEKTTELKQISKRISESQASCRKRRQEFRRGFEAFHQHQVPQLTRSEQEVESLIKENRWKEAEPLQQTIDDIIPKQRFTTEAAGTLVDNSEGVMWVADGNSPGCADGKKIDWHQAFAWAAELKYAGFDDWRLPTEEELRVLTQLPDNILNEVLPNTKRGLYWTNVPSTDVTKVLAVDFVSKKVQREVKETPHYVRPIRTPR